MTERERCPGGNTTTRTATEPASRASPEFSALSVPDIPPDDDNLTAALAWAEAGWYVLPVKRGTKKPGSIVGKHWQDKSSCDPKVIAAWFAGTDHDIAAHCGRSGGVVLDVDKPELVAEHWRTHLDTAPYQSTRPDTPRRGHYIYAMPPDRSIGNPTFPGGEIRGLNGIIVVANSFHKDGGEYRVQRAGLLPVLPDEIADQLHDSSSGEDAATDQQVKTFLAEHTSAELPDAVLGPVSNLELNIHDEDSRHASTVSALVWAMEEAAAGCYRADDAAAAIKDVFLTALARQRKPDDRIVTGQVAQSEWQGMLAWAVGQARAKTAEELTDRRARAERNSKRDNMLDSAGETVGEKAKAESNGQASTFERPKLWQAKQLKPATQPRWIAKRFVPRAAPTVFCGDEGIGKTLWDIRLIAAVSTGRALPDIHMPQRDPQPVVLAAITEEDWSTIVLPRLQVAGADLDMISVICTEEDGSGPPIYPRDFDIIREMEPKPFLIVVDSWLDTLSANLVVRDSQSAATALAPWTDLATKTDAGIILLTPTNRMASGDIREKYGVTQHLRKKARMTLFSLRDDDSDLLVLGPDKANTTTSDLAAMYRIDAIQKWEPTDDDDGTVGRLEYVATSDRTIREWVTDHHEHATNGGDDTALDKAINWLHDYLLENAPSMDSAQVKLDADAEKIKPMTLRRARRRLRVVAEPVKGEVPFKTYWRLP